MSRVLPRPTRTRACCAHLVWHDVEPRRCEASASRSLCSTAGCTVRSARLRRRVEQVGPRIHHAWCGDDSDQQRRKRRARRASEMGTLAVDGRPFADHRDRAYVGSIYLERTRRDVDRRQEPSLFSEPGVFLVRLDRTLYWVAIQSMPLRDPISAIYWPRWTSSLAKTIRHVAKHDGAPPTW